MSAGIQLIVGLGNPGMEYEHTRHNAGAWFVSHLSQAFHAPLRRAVKFHGLHAIVKENHHELHLLIPTTFMNLSGRATEAIADYYKIPPQQILIAHDEIDISPGDIRLKFDGGHGGHNGLRDIIKHLHSNQFYRLRIGVGRPPHSKEVEHYVLKPPKKSELEAINAALADAQQVLPQLLDGQFQKAIHELHSKK